jgi:hypothetical protein
MVYRSLIARGWDRWWPGGLREIAEQWSERSLSYAARAELQNTIFVKYEELGERLPAIIERLNGDREAATDASKYYLSKTPRVDSSAPWKLELEAIAGSALQAMGYNLAER